MVGEELEFWFVERDQPGYDSYNRDPLEERMKKNWKVIQVPQTSRGWPMSLSLAWTGSKTPITVRKLLRVPTQTAVIRGAKLNSHV